MAAQPPRRRSLLVIVGLVLVVGATGWALLPWIEAGLYAGLDVGLDGVAMIAAFNAYAAALALLLALVMIVLVRVRRDRLRHPRVITAALIVIMVGVAATQAPHWIPDRRPAGAGASFTLASINLHLGGADPASIVTATADADVVAFTEITERTALRLAETSFAVRFPHYLADVELPGRGAEGTMIYSRWPLAPTRPLAAGTVHENWVTSTDVPGLGRVTVVAVHAQRPFLTGTNWSSDQRLITDALPQGPLTVVAGDFNASPDQLRIPGLVGAVDLTGSGWIRTFPIDPRIPPLLRIDHVLVGDGLTVTSVATLPVQRTDHLGLRTVITTRG